MSNLIKDTQTYLSKLGFDVGPADGILGQVTTAAVIVYQYYKALNITGESDDATVRMLSEDVQKGIMAKDISAKYIPKNVEKGGGGKRLQDKSYLKSSDAISIANYTLHKEAAIGWAFMLTNARLEGFEGNVFTICSATRNKERQTQLWDNKITNLRKAYPSKTIAQLKNMARKFVADPEGGFPHGTGRALDLNLSVGGTNSGDIDAQKKTKDYAWLCKNAAKYGFYNYPVEPWHWEFNPLESKEIQAPEVQDKIAVKVNGKVIDADPINLEGRILVPARSIAEALDATVEWNDAEKKATFTLGNKKLAFYIGKAEYELNGTTLKMDTIATIINDRTFVPVRYLAESFDCSVAWDSEARMVIIASLGTNKR